MNWLDILILLVIVTSAASGLSQGFVRIGIGFAALVAGFLLASWFYGLAGAWLVAYVSSRALANVFGFVAIFVGVLILGALVAALMARALKLIGLSWADRLLGGAFGVLRGMVVVVVGLMVVTAFTAKPPKAIVDSQVAPYALKGARLLSALTPFELRDGFRRSYSVINESWGSAVRKTRSLSGKSD